MQKYGWEEFDARSGGVQTMYDEKNGIDITTHFVKIPGGNHGGSWAARIQGVVRKDAPTDLKTTVLYYATLEGLGSLEVENEKDSLGYKGDVVLAGDSDGLGSYKLVVTEGRGHRPKHSHPSYALKPLERTIVRSLQAPPEILWQVKPIVFRI
jgi:mannosyl-oligosaccharide glucosidase